MVLDQRIGDVLGVVPRPEHLADLVEHGDGDRPLDQVDQPSVSRFIRRIAHGVCSPRRTSTQVRSAETIDSTGRRRPAAARTERRRGSATSRSPGHPALSAQDRGSLEKDESVERVREFVRRQPRPRIATTAKTSGATPATRKVLASPIASETGPASAIETGIRLTETKKSSEATRPSRSGGTRRCSRVPQMTIGAQNSTPSRNELTTTHPDRRGATHHDHRQAADAPGEVHEGQVAARHRQRRLRQRPDRAADAEGGEHHRVVARVAAEAVLDHERDQHLEAGPW